MLIGKLLSLGSKVGSHGCRHVKVMELPVSKMKLSDLQIFESAAGQRKKEDKRCRLLPWLEKMKHYLIWGRCTVRIFYRCLNGVEVADDE
ncbi:hypothetical protein ACLOJK_014632 [Asimina triloba]